MESDSSSIPTSQITIYEFEVDPVKQKFESIKQMAQQMKAENDEMKEKLVEQQKAIDSRNQIIAENRDKITDLEEQNRKQEQQNIQLQKTVKENQEIIVGQAKIVSEKDNQIATLKQEIIKTVAELNVEREKEKLKLLDEITRLKATSESERENILKEKQEIIDGHANTIRQLKSEAYVKDIQISKLQATKLFDPHDLITLHKYKTTDVDMRKLVYKNKTLLLNRLTYNGQQWLDENDVEIPLDDSNCKIFVQDSLSIKSLPAAKFSPLTDRLHSNSFSKLYLETFFLSFEDFKNLVSKGDILSLNIIRITVRNDDGTLITADKLLKEVPNVKEFAYTFNDGEKMDGIAQKFAQLCSPNLSHLWFYNIQKGFDLKIFGQFIQTYATKRGCCSLRFKVSKQAFAEVERIRNEIERIVPLFFALIFYNDEI